MKWLCIFILIITTAPFRGLASVLEVQRRANFFVFRRCPSHTTLRRWINQVGLYKLQEEKVVADDWVYFVDNSIRIENRKVCLVLGARLSKLTQGQYLNYQDVEVIAMRLIQKNSEVESVIEEAITKTGIPYQICSDQGPDIMPVIRKIQKKHQSIIHIPDIMHVTGNMLKKKLESDDRWVLFVSNITSSKRKLCQSKLSCICPPSFRGKSRFFNCKNVVDWAVSALTVMEALKETDPNWKEMNDKLGWLLEQKADIQLFHELFQIEALAKEIVRKVHFASDTCNIAKTLLEEDVKSEEGRLFVDGIIHFIKEQCEKTNEDGYLLCGSSEIIESAFSKLKSLDRECGNSGFTTSLVGLAACFGDTSYQMMSRAFETVHCKDIKEWEKKHIGETILKKRRQILKPKKKEDLGSKMARFFGVKSTVCSVQL